MVPGRRVRLESTLLTLASSSKDMDRVFRISLTVSFCFTTYGRNPICPDDGDGRNTDFISRLQIIYINKGIQVQKNPDPRVMFLRDSIQGIPRLHHMHRTGAVRFITHTQINFFIQGCSLHLSLQLQYDAGPMFVTAYFFRIVLYFKKTSFIIVGTFDKSQNSDTFCLICRSPVVDRPGTSRKNGIRSRGRT